MISAKFVLTASKFMLMGAIVDLAIMAYPSNGLTPVFLWFFFPLSTITVLIGIYYLTIKKWWLFGRQPSVKNSSKWMVLALIVILPLICLQTPSIVSGAKQFLSLESYAGEKVNRQAYYESNGKYYVEINKKFTEEISVEKYYELKSTVLRIFVILTVGLCSLSIMLWKYILRRESV
jgi:hypothetical protein